MADREVQGMLIQIEATTAQLRRELANADQVVTRTTAGIDRHLARVDSSFDRTGQAAQRAGTLVKGAFAAIAGAGLLGSVIRQADAYGQMADRMRMATGSTEEYNEVQQHLLRTAQETYRPLAEAQELYIRTADVMRSLGFDTQQTLDITDSFSFLLVTNAASADKASSALGAYSKALQTGKVEADGWVSIQDAMPTIVNAIASATGKSAEEIRKLGVQGKLALEDINTGLLRTVDVNRKAAVEMSTSVQDALTNLGTALQDLIGRSNESLNATGLLAEGLGLVATNLEAVVTVGGAAALGALSGSLLQAGVAAVKHAQSLIAERSAAIAAARSALAGAEARVAFASAQMAAAEATVAAATGMRRLSLVEAELIPKQVALTASTEALAIAQRNVARAGAIGSVSGLLGVLGGPVGLAVTAGAAAASFLLLRDNADQAGVSLDDLHKPVKQLREEFQKLSRDSRDAALVEWKREEIKATEEVRAAYGDLAADIRSALVTAPARDSGGQYTKQLSEYQTLLDRLKEAKSSGEALAPILREVGERLGVDPQDIDSWVLQARALEKASDRSRDMTEKLRVLTSVTDQNTASTNANNAAKTGMSSAGQSYLDTLNKQLGTLQDNGNAIKAANRYIAENKDLTELDRQEILKSANAIEAQKKANQAATASGKARTKAVSDEIKAIDDLIDRALPEKKRLEDLAAGIEGLRKAHSLGKLSAEQLEEAIKNLNEQYGDATLQKQIQAEQKLAEIRRNSAESYRAAMELMLQAQQDSINASVSAIGLGDQEGEQQDRLNQIRKKYADLRRALEEQQEDASRRLSQFAYEQRLADLAEFQSRETQAEVDGYERRLQAMADYRNGARRAWQNIQADANDVASAMDDGLTAGFYSARDALADFATTGKLNFHDFASSVINDMARIAAQQAATSALSGLLGIGASALGGWFGGSATAGASASGYTGSAYSNWAAMQADGGAWANGVQFFANGGVFTNSVVNTPTAFGMAGGRMGMVGEAGPEAILPLARNSDGSLGVRMVGGMSAGGATTVQVNMPMEFVMEDRSSDGMALDPQALQKGMEQQMRSIAEKVVADSWRPGGMSFRQSIGRG
ncbi:TPA: phage tail tape measure protein [Pseudomonas aeruginosa]|uniref:phage tail tape measure protein n=2 Tax=Pseudomonas aeruginosa TaxID=287 RepID=UPI0004F2CEE1|nr:phage tail tape measure protein [Pseudomonas aeruginosa]ALZ15582.1 phage tail tape measure protein [Pseudomonas aeruginosa]EKW6684110.1 phage tail tape measure protein [Pseudomonas aeruginosa]ELK4910914.1 phage tail tape measure protein [Pseudomonas aeruginosa]ELL2376475.1 phage tail tape measure protein [Pseudomonas aeruginosa]ELS0938530.1 phage tail tape measure protein [Pseudomonas aeruginosa]